MGVVNLLSAFNIKILKSEFGNLWSCKVLAWQMVGFHERVKISPIHMIFQPRGCFELITMLCVHIKDCYNITAETNFIETV